MRLVVWDPEQTHSRRLPLYADATSDSTGPACRAWPQGTCSVSPKTSLRTTCPTPLSWDVRSCASKARPQAMPQAAKPFTSSTISGTGSVLFLSSTPRSDIFFGKVTMYPSYLSECRDMILHFYHKYFPDPDCLVTPINPLRPASESSDIERMFCGGRLPRGLQDTPTRPYTRPRTEHSAAGQLLHEPLAHDAMLRHRRQHTEFGDVEETGILVTIDDIFDTKKQRYIDTYRGNLSQSLTDLQDGFQSNHDMLLTESRRLSTSYGLLTLQAPAPLPLTSSLDNSYGYVWTRPNPHFCDAQFPSTTPTAKRRDPPAGPCGRRRHRSIACRRPRTDHQHDTSARTRIHHAGAAAPESILLIGGGVGVAPLLLLGRRRVKPASIRNFCLGALRIRPVAAAEFSETGTVHITDRRRLGRRTRCCHRPLAPSPSRSTESTAAAPCP